MNPQFIKPIARFFPTFYTFTLTMGIFKSITNFTTGAVLCTAYTFLTYKSKKMGKAKVFIEDQEYKAKYKVFFVDQANQEKNTQLITPGELVKQEYQADVKVFIVNQEYKADIKIMRKNFPN